MRERSRWWIPVVCGLALVWGCAGQSEECERSDEGAIVLTIVPELTGNDMLLSRTFNARLESVGQINTAPPIVRYQLRRTDNDQVVFLETNDLGYVLPLTEGVAYDVLLQRGTVIERLLFSWAAVFTDEEGVAGMLVTDWEPGFSVLSSGGPDPTWDPPEGFGLQVAVADGGCEPRIENSDRFRDITNRKLSFGLNNQIRDLFHGSSGSLGDYDIRVFRAQRAVAKDSNLNIINQYSFALGRVR